MPSFYRNKEAPDQVAQARRTAEVAPEQDGGITEKTGIRFGDVNAGIADQRNTFTDRAECDTEQARTVNAAPESHRGFTGFPVQVFGVQKIRNFLCPDIKTGRFGFCPARAENRRREEKAKQNSNQKQEKQNPEPGEPDESCFSCGNDSGSGGGEGES